MKVILDSNVIIAAFAARGLCSVVFELCLDRFEVVVSEAILKETFTHLLNKIRLPQSRCQMIDAYLRSQWTLSPVDPVEASACRDPNDLHILGLAQHSAADDIITGDKDLLDLVAFKKAKILTPREFWAVVKKLHES